MHCDFFFLWGYLKHRIYAAPRSNTLSELKMRIETEMTAIPQEMIIKVIQEIRLRCEKCTIF